MFNPLPRHIAIIMDGNGRWAERQCLPRLVGHRSGLKVARKVAKACADKGVEYLTLFAFSSENWHRPQEEVRHLMNLFLTALEKESLRLHKNNIRLLIIGNQQNFKPVLRKKIQEAQALTAENTGLTLVIAADYGGRWDIVQAAQVIARQVLDQQLQITDINEQYFSQLLVTKAIPEPELLIRTGGEQRVSNFLLWQLAYTELYFTATLWPDFSSEHLDQACEFYAQKERRFGKTSEQIRENIIS